MTSSEAAARKSHLPRISVNIPTWSRKQLLLELLESLLNQDLPSSDYEILVCDSSSPDGTREMVEKLSSDHANLHFLNIETNTLAAKRNALARGSRAPLLLLLDDDARATPRLLSSHLAAHERFDGIVGCGAIRYPAEWVRASNYFRFRDSRHMGPTRPDIDPSLVPGKNWTVMNMSVRREHALSYGLMDESFTRYGAEDHEFAERWERRGIRGVFVPDALVWHCEAGGNLRQFERKIYFCSRYGFHQLLKIYPRYLDGSNLALLEPAPSAYGLLPRARAMLIRMVMHRVIAKPVRAWLELTERRRWAYSPRLYRYLMASAHYHGARDRERVSNDGWL